MIIEITERHIEDGAVDDPNMCPVVLALCEATRGDWQRDDECTVTFRDGADSFQATLPDEATSFLQRLREDDPAKPMHFEMGMPWE